MAALGEHAIRIPALYVLMAHDVGAPLMHEYVVLQCRLRIEHAIQNLVFHVHEREYLVEVLHFLADDHADGVSGVVCQLSGGDEHRPVLDDVSVFVHRHVRSRDDAHA